MKIYKNDDGIEVWEVTKEDFEITCHQGALISNIENTDIPFYYYFSFNSEDLCSIPNKIEIYKKGESSIDHIQYFPIALISECLWDLVGWHEIQLRNLYGIKKHLEHTFDDWQGGSSYYHEFVPLSFQESISISSPNSDTYFGSYYFKNFMSKKERNKIYEKQKELFKDYVEDLTEKFKWHFLDNLDNTPLIKDKKSLLKRKKKFLKEVLVNPDIQANGIISIENRNYGSMIFGDGENEKLVPHHCDYQIFLNNHQLKRLKELYKNNFLGGDGIFYYGFVKCPHFYKQSNKNEELEILCFALFNFRSWLLKLDIKNIRETKLVGTTIHKYKSFEDWILSKKTYFQYWRAHYSFVSNPDKEQTPRWKLEDPERPYADGIINYLSIEDQDKIWNHILSEFEICKNYFIKPLKEKLNHRLDSALYPIRLIDEEVKTISSYLDGSFESPFILSMDRSPNEPNGQFHTNYKEDKKISEYYHEYIIKNEAYDLSGFHFEFSKTFYADGDYVYIILAYALEDYKNYLLELNDPMIQKVEEDKESTKETWEAVKKTTNVRFPKERLSEIIYPEYIDRVYEDEKILRDIFPQISISDLLRYIVLLDKYKYFNSRGTSRNALKHVIDFYGKRFKKNFENLNKPSKYRLDKYQNGLQLFYWIDAPKN